MQSRTLQNNSLSNWKNPSLFVKVFVVSAIVCISFGFRFQNTRQLIYLHKLQADSQQYLNYAYNLAERGTFSVKFSQEPAVPDSLRSPGYPLFVAAVYKIWGKEAFFPKVMELQTVLGAATVLLTYLIGTMFLPFWGAAAACLLIGFSPHHVMVNNFLLTETMFSFAVLAALFCILKAFKHRSFYLFFGAGLLFGYAYLVNETLLLFPFLLLLILLQKRSDAPKADYYFQVIAVLVFLFVYSLFPLMWSYRNANLSAGSLTGHTRALNTLTHGTYPGFIYKTKNFLYYPYKEDPLQPAYSQSLENFFPIFFERVKQRPLRYLSWYLLEKPYYLWSWKMLQARDEIYVYPVENSVYQRFRLIGFTKDIMKLLHPFVLICSVSGVFLLLQKKMRRKNIAESPVLLYGLMGYYTLLYTVFASWPRYSIPFRPEFYLTAVWAVVAMGRFYLHKKEEIKGGNDFSGRQKWV